MTNMTEAAEDAWVAKRAAALAYRAKPGSWTTYHGTEGPQSMVPCTCLTEGACAVKYHNPEATRKRQDRTNARRKAARVERKALHYIGR